MRALVHLPYHEHEAQVQAQVPKLRTPLADVGLPLELCRRLVVAGADINQVDLERHTPLHIFAGAGRLDIVRYLITQRAPVNDCSLNGCGAMHAAAQEGYADVVRLLLQAMGDPNLISQEGAPLHCAAAQGNDDVVRVLLGHSCNCDPPAPVSGATPLFLACRSGHSKVVNYLLASNANPDTLVLPGCRFPLYEAALAGHEEVVKSLILFGADITAETQSGDTALGAALQNGYETVAARLHAISAKVDPAALHPEPPLPFIDPLQEARATKEEEQDDTDDYEDPFQHLLPPCTAPADPDGSPERQTVQQWAEGGLRLEREHWQVSQTVFYPPEEEACDSCFEALGDEDSSQVLDRKYHTRCVVCSHCGGPFETLDCQLVDDQLYHVKCAELLLPGEAVACGGCGGPVTGDGQVALHQVWHPGCFVCGLCRQPFEHGFIVGLYRGVRQPFHAHCPPPSPTPLVLDHPVAKQRMICHACQAPIAGSACIHPDTAGGSHPQPVHPLCVDPKALRRKGLGQPPQFVDLSFPATATSLYQVWCPDLKCAPSGWSRPQMFLPYHDHDPVPVLFHKCVSPLGIHQGTKPSLPISLGPLCTLSLSQSLIPASSLSPSPTPPYKKLR